MCLVSWTYIIYYQTPIRKEHKPYMTFEASIGLYQLYYFAFGISNGIAAFQRFFYQIIKNERINDTFVYTDTLFNFMEIAKYLTWDLTTMYT